MPRHALKMMGFSRRTQVSPRFRRPRVNSDDTMKKLDQLIEALTTSGRSELDPNQLKSLKKICKRGDRFVEQAFGELWDQLNKEHSEIRLSSIQICDVLFQRSHRFRDLILTQFEEFTQLVMAVNVGTSLPPPQSAAKQLYQTAVKTIHQWNNKYRTAYKKLALGYSYLKTVKKIDFSGSEPRTPAEQQNSEERRRRLDDYRIQRLERLIRDIEETTPEMEACVVELRNCFELLLPNQGFMPDWQKIMDSGPKGKGLGKKSTSDKSKESLTSSGLKITESNVSENKSENFSTITNERNSDNGKNLDPEPSTSGFQNSSENRDDDSDSDEDDFDFVEVPCKEETLLRMHGYTDRNFQLQIDVIPTLEESDDNREVIRNMNDRDKLVASKYMPTVITWLENLSKLGAPLAIIKKIIDMKGTLSDARQKYQQLSSKIRFTPSPALSCPPMDQSHHSEETAQERKTPGHHGNRENGNHSNKAESSTVAAPGSDRKSQLLSVAPFVRYDKDLKFWGREQELKPTPMVKGQSSHRFLSATEQEEFLPPGACAATERTMTFVGQLPKIEWMCRAPLKNGKLCPRQDRYKCPFHGKIIERDAIGEPINTEDKPQFNWGEQGETQTWQDADLMEDIEGATGVDLGATKAKAGKTKKRKYPGLTDLNKAKNTCTRRIEKKVFNKAAMKRVNSAMNKMDARKFENKFGSQFVHTFKK